MATRPKIDGVCPILEVGDIARATRFYRDVLGFEVGFVYDQPPSYAICCRGDFELQFRLVPEVKSRSIVYLYTTEIKKLYRTLVNEGAPVVGPPKSRAYGMIEFDLRDPDGHLLRFGESDPTASMG